MLLSPNTPIAWTIAGSDSGGGAGIQADLKTMNAFGVHGCSVTTAITAQNTLGVNAVEYVSDTLVEQQLETLIHDLFPDAIKTGMLGHAGICAMLPTYLRLPGIAVVCDPVLRATHGQTLLDESALTEFKRKILPHVTVLTPNLPEAALLLNEERSIEESAKKLLDLGPASVLIKGGHADGDESTDYWTDGKNAIWLSSPRIQTRHSHGTGCILSSAIAAALALGQEIPDAVIAAKTYLNQCLKSPANVGAGHGPMMMQSFCNHSGDRPNIKHK